MNGVAHFQVRTTARQAQRSLAQLLMWNRSATDIDRFESSCLWVPFHPVTYKRLTALPAARLQPSPPLTLSMETDVIGNAQEGFPEGQYLDPPAKEDAIFVPFYWFSEPGSGRDAVWVNAVTGRIAGGKLEADSRFAVVRLLGLVMIVLFTMMLTAVYGNTMIETIFSLAGPPLISTTAQRLAGVVAVALYCGIAFGLYRCVLRLRKWFWGMLYEPIIRIQTGFIQLPLDRRWLTLLKILGISMAVLAVLLGLSLIVPGPGGPFSMLLRIIQLALAVALVYTALRYTHGKTMRPVARRGTSAVTDLPDGDLPEMVRVVINVSLFTFYGLLLGTMLEIDLPYLDTLRRFLIQVEPGSLVGLGARVGAIFGILTSGIPRRESITLTGAIFIEMISDLFIAPWMGVPLVLSGVAFLGWITNRDDNPPAIRLRKAIYNAWAFCLGAAIGSLGGQIFGFVFMGPAGMVVGEIIGDHILATTAFMAQTRSSVSKSFLHREVQSAE
ncbi:hypothetical protein D3OALGB2SA_5356 [Olavius algarvensis associated proteobacterium Delta 3]|nr:hypothetical protein D3OALGB2SA_5356 [Olavius algarvensis associated proteobacterium Delta 3]